MYFGLSQPYAMGQNQRVFLLISAKIHALFPLPTPNNMVVNRDTAFIGVLIKVK